MKSLSLGGFAAVAGGLGLLGFQSLSSLMHKDNAWRQFTLGGVAGDWVDAVLTRMPEGMLQDKLLFLANDLPLYQLLVGLGVILIVLGAVFRK